jgi:hypothetical protein
MSQVDAAMAQKAREVPPGSFRHTVLQSARRFKASWVELGKLLVKVRDEALFQEWAFESFEQYCSRELHIRKATADKLVRAFSFLNRHEPKRMESEDVQETAPAFEVVEVLADAEDRGKLSAAEYRTVRDAIWNPEKPVAEMRRELYDRFPREEAPPASDSASLKRLAAFARKLAAELSSNKKVPRAVSERAEALAEDVQELANAERTRA